MLCNLAWIVPLSFSEQDLGRGEAIIFTDVYICSYLSLEVRPQADGLENISQYSLLLFFQKNSCGKKSEFKVICTSQPHPLKSVY